MGQVIKIGGRRFVAHLDGTLDHDDWLVGEIFGSGIQDLPPVLDDEDPDKYAFRIISTIAQRRKTMILIGGMLLPEGAKPKDWTPAISEEIAAFIGGLTSDEDRLIKNALVGQLLAGFFRSGLVSLKIFASYSKASELEMQPVPESLTRLADGEN